MVATRGPVAREEERPLPVARAVASVTSLQRQRHPMASVVSIQGCNAAATAEPSPGGRLMALYVLACVTMLIPLATLPREMAWAVVVWMLWTGVQVAGLCFGTNNALNGTVKRVLDGFARFTETFTDFQKAVVSVTTKGLLLHAVIESIAIWNRQMLCELGTKHCFRLQINECVFNSACFLWAIIAIFHQLYDWRPWRVAVLSSLLFIVLWTNATFVHSYRSGKPLPFDGDFMHEFADHWGSLARYWNVNNKYKITNFVFFSVVSSSSFQDFYVIFLQTNVLHWFRMGRFVYEVLVDLYAA